MTPETIRLCGLLLENQKDLISAIVGVTTNDQLECLRAISEAQYNIAEALMPSPLVEISGSGDDGPVTLQ